MEFSSFESRVPIVLQKTFIFPLPVTALGITLTQYGITSKNILVGTAVGQVLRNVCYFMLDIVLLQMPPASRSLCLCEG